MALSKNIFLKGIGELLIKYIHDMGHQATVAETLSRGVETALSVSMAS